MKHLQKLVILIFFLASIYQAQSANDNSANELCKLKEKDLDQTISQQITTAPLHVSQNTCVQRFTLDLDDPSFKNKKYIYVEVQFEPFPSSPPEFYMIFLEGDEEKPYIYVHKDGLSENATTDDYDAYRNSKNFHRIVLDAANIRKGGMRYFAVYKLFNNLNRYPNDLHVVSYSIKALASSSSTFQCINGCNNNGTCDSNLQQCKCFTGYFDSDCSIKALRLNAGIPQSQPVPAKDSAYYYTSYQDPDDIFTFSFKLDRPGWDVALQFNKPNDFLINSRRAFQLTNQYPMLGLETSQELSALSIPALKAYVGGHILVFISNPTNNAMYSTVQVDYRGNIEEKSRLILTIAIVAGVVLFLIVVGAFITAKCRARRAQGAQNVELEGVPRDERQRAPRANRPNPQQSLFLTKVDIERYFPLKQFSKLKTGFPQSACSICLDEFVPDSKCHQLYCEHIFHDNCIESWLAKQSNCPNCKSEMNKQAIRKFFKDQKQAKPSEPNKQQAEPQQVEIHINEQQEQADRNNLENSVYENSEENPIELNSPFSSPLASPHSSRMIMERHAPAHIGSESNI